MSIRLLYGGKYRILTLTVTDFDGRPFEKVTHKIENSLNNQRSSPKC